jgi:hypothetical protein
MGLYKKDAIHIFFMLPSDRPRTNVSQAFADNFKVVQEKWLQSDDLFKSGMLFYGSVAANQIKNMHYLLPASRVIADDIANKTDKHQEFIDALDAFRLKCSQYAMARQVKLLPQSQFPLVPDYITLDNEYDALVRQFYLMMFEKGFSP